MSCSNTVVVATAIVVIVIQSEQRKKKNKRRWRIAKYCIFDEPFPESVSVC